MAVVLEHLAVYLVAAFIFCILGDVARKLYYFIKRYIKILFKLFRRF